MSSMKGSLNASSMSFAKRVETAIRESAIQGRDYFYISSLSANTIVYKGLLLPEQMSDVLPGLEG